MTKAQFRRFFRDIEIVDDRTDGVFREGLLSESQIDVVFRKSVKRCKQCKAKICFQDFLMSLSLAAEEIYDSEEESARLLREVLRRKQSDRVIESATLNNFGNRSKALLSFLFRYTEPIVENECFLRIQHIFPILRRCRVVVLVQKTVECVHIRPIDITSQKTLEQQNKMVELVSARIGMIDTNPLM